MKCAVQNWDRIMTTTAVTVANKATSASVQNAKLLVSVAEAAEMLSIGRSSMYRLIASAKLPIVQLGLGRSHQRIRVSVLERLIDSRTFGCVSS